MPTHLWYLKVDGLMINLDMICDPLPSFFTFIWLRVSTAADSCAFVDPNICNCTEQMVRVFFPQMHQGWSLIKECWQPKNKNYQATEIDDACWPESNKTTRNTKDLTKNKPERPRTKAATLMRHADVSENTQAASECSDCSALADQQTLGAHSHGVEELNM